MKLFILNDDVNNFDFVISTIQKHLGYPYTQACSIANIVHQSGRCLVRTTDSESEMSELFNILQEKGLSIEVE